MGLFSVHLFGTSPDLPGYAWIEFPAPESANPLLIPLAGHELGHSLWVVEDLERSLSDKIHNEIVRGLETSLSEFIRLFKLDINIKQAALTTDTSIMELYERSEKWLLYQAEESFCDFVGLRLFGHSSLEAFSYLISPKLSGVRSELYPNNVARAKNLVRAAFIFGLPTLPDYLALLEDDTDPTDTEAEKIPAGSN